LAYLELWQLLAGLGFFLYGMMQIELALKGFGSDTFTTFLQNQTKSPLRGVIGGMLATAFLQSSSIVGLMVLAFIGAGILQLRNALGIIFGANLGTTFTAWLVTLLGFKLNLDSISLPLLAIGSLTIAFLKPHSRLFLWGVLAFGFGLLLFGLSFMKNSVESLAALNIAEFTHYSPIYFVIIGAVLTAIVQSSSAATMIILSALHGGIIDLPSGAALAIGSNVGTTITLILASINGSADKKRVAAAHFLFNTVTAIIVFSVLGPLLKAIQFIFVTDDDLYLLTIFHTIFNLLGVILFLPFTQPLANTLNRFFKKPSKKATAFISSVPSLISKEVMEAAIITVQKEAHRLLFKVLILEARTFKIDENSIISSQQKQNYRIHSSAQKFTYEECYSELKEIEGELMAYIYSVQNNTSYPEQSKQLSAIHHSVHMMVYAAKTIKDVRHDLVELRHAKDIPSAFSYDQLEKTIKYFCHQLIGLHQISNNKAYEEKMQELHSALQHEYDLRRDALILSAQKSIVSDIQLSTLLHINKAILTSSKTLLDALEAPF
jgi:phosphate:Na+ symporter